MKSERTRYRAEMREKVAQTIVYDCLDGLSQTTTWDKDTLFYQILYYLGWSHREIASMQRDMDDKSSTSPERERSSQKTILRERGSSFSPSSTTNTDK